MTDENALGASLVEYGLQAAQKLSALDDRLVAVKKAITSIETGRLKLTHRLAEEIRRTLKGVIKNAKATPEQLIVANDLKSRVFARSPLRKKARKQERVLDDVVSTGNLGSILDGAVAAKDKNLWTTDDFDERVRLMAIDREGGDFKSRIRKALDGRAETVPNLVLLLTFVRKHSIRGPMFEKLDRTLIEMGAVSEEVFDWGEVGHPSTWIEYERDSTGAFVYYTDPQSPMFGYRKTK